MAQEPERLRRDIEGTRASLTRDVDLLAEKTSPRQAARRQWTTVKEKVMGTADQARDTTGDKAAAVKDKVSDRAHDTADAVRSAPQAVVRQAQGNPIAAGVIAFGVGMLAATLIPVTEAERRAGRQIRDNSDELTDQIKDKAAELGSELKTDLQEAATQVKETAQDAAQNTGNQAQSSAQDAGEQVKQTAQQQRR
jgi:gas vesicle protein